MRPEEARILGRGRLGRAPRQGSGDEVPPSVGLPRCGFHTGTDRFDEILLGAGEW